MSWSLFSEEELISRVRAYPELYDVRHKDYKNIQRRMAIWIEIADGFFEDDIDAETCAKKWKRCRDSYFRSKREIKMKSGQAASKKKPYKFSDLLRFLDDHNHKIPPPCRESSLESAPGEHLEAVDSETVKELLEETYSQHSSVFDDQDAPGFDGDPLQHPPRKEDIEETRTDEEPHPDRPSMASRGHFMTTQTSSPASSSRSSFSPKFRRRFMPEPSAEPQPKRGMKKTYEEPRKDALEEAVVASLQAQNDEDSLFGLTIGTTLKRFPRVIKSKVKLDMMKLLFDAEVEMAGRN